MCVSTSSHNSLTPYRILHSKSHDLTANPLQIGINLTDDQYSGLYHGTQRHPSDIYEVIERAKSIGCTKMIVTGSDIESSTRAIELAKVFRTPSPFLPLSSPRARSFAIAHIQALAHERTQLIDATKQPTRSSQPSASTLALPPLSQIRQPHSQSSASSATSPTPPLLTSPRMASSASITTAWNTVRRNTRSHPSTSNSTSSPLSLPSCTSLCSYTAAPRTRILCVFWKSTWRKGSWRRGAWYIVLRGRGTRWRN